MPNLEFTLFNHNHTISCEEGEEERILGLVEEINEKYKNLTIQFGVASEMQLVGILVLMMQDELAQVKDKNVQLEERGNINDVSKIVEKELAETIDGIAERIENIAKKVKND